MLSKQHFRLILVLIGLIGTFLLLSCKSRQVALNKHSSASQSTTKITDKSVDSLSVTVINKSVTKTIKTDSTKTFQSDTLEVTADSIWVDVAGNVKAKGNAKATKKSKKQVNVNTKEVDEEIKELIENLEYKHEANIEAVKEVKIKEESLVKETVSKPSIMTTIALWLLISAVIFAVWKMVKKVF